MAQASHARVLAARSRLAPRRRCSTQAQATAPPPPLRAAARRLRSHRGAEAALAGRRRARAADEERRRARARPMRAAGAAAVSVLTEPSRFDGSLAHLSAAARRCAARGAGDAQGFPGRSLPGARGARRGAGGVLIILRMLSRAAAGCAASAAQRAAGCSCCSRPSMRSDLGAHARADRLALRGRRSTARRASTAAIWTTLAGRARSGSSELAPLLPAGVPRVAESGVASAEDARRVAAAGYELALVGSALMQRQRSAGARARAARGRARAPASDARSMWIKICGITMRRRWRGARRPAWMRSASCSRPRRGS